MKFSIITVTYNSEQFIRKTIESVLEQTYPDIEYIVVDGNSTDSTCKIIKEYQDRISIFISEPDENMYDAINKGMKLSSGDYISILNSDDYYVDKYVISKVARYISQYKDKYAGVYGDLVKVDVNGKVIRKRKGFQIGYDELLYSKKLSIVGHATFFMPRISLETVGFYDYKKFSYACDYDFILRCFKHDRYKHIDIYIMCFRMHENSITASGKLTKEITEVLAKHNYNKRSKLKRYIMYKYLWGKFIVKNVKFLLNKVI